MFETPTPDLWGRRLARWRRGSYSRLIRSSGSFPVLKALLERSELIVVFFDLPGQRMTHFLGKPAMLADGTARLAVETDSVILPVRTRRAGHRPCVDFGASLDPRSFDGVEPLHNALAAQHERWILERPAEMEDPCSFGWAAGATPQAWNRPEPKNPLQ